MGCRPSERAQHYFDHRPAVITRVCRPEYPEGESGIPIGGFQHGKRCPCPRSPGGIHQSREKSPLATVSQPQEVFLRETGFELSTPGERGTLCAVEDWTLSGQAVLQADAGG